MKRTFQMTALAAIGAAGLLAAGCGQEKPQVNNRAAHLFADRCAGCHTLTAAATRGSNGVPPTGPNLDYRNEDRKQALYAIRNGGFSGAIMPQNIVVGKDAELVADFVAKYAGSKSTAPPSPSNPSSGGQ